MKKILTITIISLIIIMGIVLLILFFNGLFESEIQGEVVIEDCGTVIFIYNNQEVTYGTIKSPNTGKCWLDRNLGANRLAESKTNNKAYGDLFQWGRGDDGHQIRTSSITEIQANNINPGHDEFIITHNNWLNPQNNDLWQGVDGFNNPCPVGWRLPVITEWEAEFDGRNWDNPNNAYSDLKLTLSGYRYFNNPGHVGHMDILGYYWSSSLFADFSPFYMYIGDDGVHVLNSPFAQGHSIRCIKD